VDARDRDPSANPVDDDADLEELRVLLLRREQAQLRDLHERLDDRERRARDMAGVLPQAVKLSRNERGEEFSRALQPAVDDGIQAALEQRPKVFIDALTPHIGALVRSYINESLRGLIQSLNQTLEHTFSVQGLKWRYEALRTGKSFAEVVMLRSMIYRVEEVFLFHRETSLTLLHVSADGGADKDAEMFAGMLSAIQDFGRDCLQTGADSALDEFRIGELTVWVATGRAAYLAAIISGTPPRELRGILEETIENVHILKGADLLRFNGDADVFEPLRPDLEACLRAQRREEKPEGKRPFNKAALVLGAAAAALLLAVGFAVRAEWRWRDFLRHLDAQPGIAVTAQRHSWFGASRVDALRDPLAADPAALASESGVDPARVEFVWKPFLALDPVSVRRRFEQRFPPAPGTRIDVRDGGALGIAGAAPYEWLERVRREGAQVPGVTAISEQPGLTVTYDPALARERFHQAFPPPPGVDARVKNGALLLSGQAPYEWLAPVREGAARLPGIRVVDEKGLQIIYEPSLALHRFENRFGLPDTISAAMRDGGTLVLTGEASHGWLTRVRKAAVQVPGIVSVDESGLTDLDLQTFQQSKSIIENAFIYFLPNKENFASEGFAVLSRLPDEIRRCRSGAKRIGVEIEITVLGSADSMGPETKNMELSQRRANAVRDFLVSCGLEASLFKPTGMGAPAVPAEGGAAAKPASEQSQRRVAFLVGYPLSSPAP
jgi:outer membrane protein OmpA-like peptidoglycan-associated protein